MPTSTTMGSLKMLGHPMAPTTRQDEGQHHFGLGRRPGSPRAASDAAASTRRASSIIESSAGLP